MTKSMLALASFIAGMLCSVLLGNHTSRSLQPVASAQSLVRVEGAVPIVPIVPGVITENNTINGGTILLDGQFVRNSILRRVTFEYGGGAYRLDSLTIEPPVGIHLIGAALNTADLLSKFGLIGCPNTPNPHNAPNPPNPKTPDTMEAKIGFKGNLVSPVGQK